MKPLLVIVLVLAAVGALLFAVFTLGGGGDKTGAAGVAPTPRDQVVQPAGRTDLPPLDDARLDTGQEGSRAATPAVVEDRVRVSEGTGFANELVGSVQDEAGQPVPGARVTLTRHAAQMITFVNEAVDRSGDRRTETGKDGTFSFANIEPYGHYALVVEHPDYARIEEQASPVTFSGRIQEPPIVLHQGARLYGVVSNTEGDGVGDAKLTLYGTFHSLGSNDSPDQLVTRSDNGGAFEFKNVPPGHRTLSVTALGYGNAMIGGLQVERGVDLERNLTLELAEMICGTVVGPGNVPIAGAQVIAQSYASGPRQCRDTAVTELDGRFCLEHVRPGQYTVAVSKAGYKPAREARVEAGDTTLIIELKPQSSISGVVLARDTGQPVSVFELQLRVTYENTDQTGPVGPRVTVRNERGEFTIDDVAEGTFVVEAQAEGYAPTFSDRIRVGASQEVAGVMVQLAKGGTIVGQVVDPDGEPVAGAMVETRDTTWTDDYFVTVVLGDQYPTNASHKQVRTGADGRFRIDALNPENYQVRVKTDRFTELVKAGLQVTDGGTTDVGVLRLEAGGTVTGTVLGADGQIVPGAQIQLRPDGPSQGQVLRTGKANARGVFAIHNVVPGNYRISALAAGGGGADIFGPMNDQLRSERAVVVSAGREQRIELKLGG